MNKTELSDLGIKQWNEIENEYSGADLLLGNGFSVSVAPSLHYNSLFEEFLSCCNDEEKSIYRAFNTCNFEFILSDLMGASKVNRIFGLETEKVDRAVIRLRNVLIEAIEHKHPRVSNFDWDHLRELSKHFDKFQDIYTTNYDVLIYHIIMISLDRYWADEGVKRYNDYFWNRIDDRHLEFMDYQNYPEYRHVYFLHGALFLFKHEHLEVKLSRKGNDELVDCIRDEITSGHLPLFVSEGSHEDKLKAIGRSRYLNFALKMLRSSTNAIVVFGSSLSDPDKHICDAVARSGKRVAYAVYVGAKTKAQLDQELSDLRHRLSIKHLDFFDSSTIFMRSNPGV